jgi:hypothetical protein
LLLLYLIIAGSAVLKTPLQVTIILLIIKNGGRPPGEREALFNEYWQTILKREKSKDKDIIKSDDNTLLNLHAYLGYLLHCRASNNNVKSLLSEIELEGAITQSLRNRDSQSSDKDINLKVKQFICDAKDRLVLIVSPQPELFGFELRSFQEFFAAVYLFKIGNRFENLKSKVCSEHWNNVALFLAGRIARELGDDAEGILRSVCRAVDRPQPIDDKNKNHYLRPGAWFALEVAADGSLSKNYRDFQYGVIEYGLEVLETGLTKAQQHKLNSLTGQLSEKDQRELLRPILEGKFCSKNLPETCWEIALNFYGRHFRTTQFFLEKIDFLLETQKKNFVLSALRLALLYESEPVWMVGRLQRHWSFWKNNIPDEFFRPSKYLENLLNIWEISEVEATKIAETICEHPNRYIEMYSRKKFDLDMPQPKTLSEQLILMLRCFGFANNWRMETSNRFDIAIKHDEDEDVSKAVLHIRARLNYTSSPHSVSDDITNAIDAMLQRPDFMPWLRVSLWVIYWLINQPNQTNVKAFLEDINSYPQIHQFIKKSWFYSTLREAWPLLALVINLQQMEGQDAVDKLLPFVDAKTQISIDKRIKGTIKEYFEQSEIEKQQQLNIALQTKIGLEEFLPELEHLAASMSMKIEDLVDAYIIVYPSYMLSNVSSINFANEQIKKLLTTAENLIKQGEIPAKLLWTLINSRWIFDSVIVKKACQLLELILDHYSEESDLPVTSIIVALFLKLLIYDTQVEKYASRLFTTLPSVKILEIRRPWLPREAVVESDSKFLHIMESLLAHKEETVRIGIALVLKLIIDSENQRQYSRKYNIFQGLNKFRIDFDLGMSFINHENSKYRVVGITLLTLSDYPVEDIKHRNLILDNLKKLKTDEEEEAWHQFLQEVYMSEEKYTMWHLVLEGILSKPSFYNSSILSLAMERYQEINSSIIDATIPEID